METKLTKPLGKLICLCNEAFENCYLLCDKGRKLNPDEVFYYAGWPKTKPKKELN